jgi:hypothetical protein
VRPNNNLHLELRLSEWSCTFTPRLRDVYTTYLLLLLPLREKVSGEISGPATLYATSENYIQALNSCHQPGNSQSDASAVNLCKKDGLH